MADDKKHSNWKNEKRNPELRVPPRTWIIWIAILGLTVLLWNLRGRVDTKFETLTYPEFVSLVEKEQVEEGVISYNPQSEALREITGKYRKPESSEVIAFKIKTRLLPEIEEKLLTSGKFQTVEPNTLLQGILFSLLPFVLLALLVWFFLIRQIRMAGKGALSFGKSRARMLNREKNRTTFKDVAGIEEAKDEVYELVEFLKDPKKFQKLGGRIPKGILHGWRAGHRQDAAGQGHRRRGGRSVLQHQRVGFRGDVCWGGCDPGA